MNVSNIGENWRYIGWQRMPLLMLPNDIHVQIAIEFSQHLQQSNFIRQICIRMNSTVIFVAWHSRWKRICSNIAMCIRIKSTSANSAIGLFGKNRICFHTNALLISIYDSLNAMNAANDTSTDRCYWNIWNHIIRMRTITNAGVAIKRKRHSSFAIFNFFYSHFPLAIRFFAQYLLKKHMRLRHMPDAEEARPNPNSNPSGEYNEFVYRPKLNSRFLWKNAFFTDKRFICEICGKHLTQMAGLLAHIKYVHSDERPCRCQHCGLGYWLFWSIHLNMDYIFDAIHFNFSDIKPSIYWSRILPPTLALNSSVHNVRKLFAKRLAWKDTWHSMQRRK